MMMEQLSPLVGDAGRPVASKPTTAEPKDSTTPPVVLPPPETAGERASERAPSNPRVSASTEGPSRAAPETGGGDVPQVVPPSTGAAEGEAPERPLVDTRPPEVVVEPRPSAPEPGPVERSAAAVETDAMASEGRRSSAEDPTAAAGEAPLDPPPPLSPEVVVVEDDDDGDVAEDGSPKQAAARDAGAPARNLPESGQRAGAALSEPSPAPVEPSPVGAGAGPSSPSAVLDDPLALGAGRRRPRGDPQERAAFQRLLTAGQVCLLSSSRALSS